MLFLASHKDITHTKMAELQISEIYDSGECERLVHLSPIVSVLFVASSVTGCRLKLKCDGPRRRTGGGSEGETGEMEWVSSTLHTTTEHGASSITTADAHTSAASSRLK